MLLRPIHALGLGVLVPLLACCGSTSDGDAVLVDDDGQTTGGGGQGDGGAPFLDTYPLSAAFPEGGAYDAIDHAFFVGSLGDGSIHRVDAATGATEQVFVESAEGPWWTLGLPVDESRRKLWACAMKDLRGTGADPQYDGWVWSFDLATGEREIAAPLTAGDAEATCTDVVVDADGTVYVTDRDFGNVYTVGAGGDVALFVADALLEGGLAGQNAAVIVPGTRTMLVTVYSPARLVAIDLDARSVRAVDIEGDFAGGDALAGADGLAYADGAAWVAFDSRVVKLTPADASWSAATATAHTVAGGMTDVVAAGGALYLLNGQAIRFALGLPTDPFQLERFSPAD